MAKKKLYQKPEVKQIKLVPEEAVLTACKIAADGATNGSGANKCNVGAVNACKAIGT